MRSPVIGQPPGTQLEAYGALVVVDEGLRIVHASECCDVVVGIAAERLVGAPIGALLAEADVQRLATALADGTAGASWLRVQLVGGGEQMKLHAFEPAPGLVGIDILPLPAEAPGTDAEAVERVAGWSERLLASESTPELLAAAAAVARERTRFDGAWVTRLEPGGHSEILASDMADGSSLVGRRVPPADVPPGQPRLRGRLIPFFVADLQAPPAELVPPADGLDLQGSSLLRPFPAYLRHLTEIGVRAIASVPIVVDGELWGRIASASATPRRLTATTQAELRLIGGAVANHLSELLALDDARERVELSRFSHRVIRAVAGTPDLVDGLVADERALVGVCDADAALARIGGREMTVGGPPAGDARTQLFDLARRELLQGGAGPVASSTAIDTREGVDRAIAAGFLAVELVPGSGDLIVWLRGEQRQRRTWLAHRAAEGAPPPATLRDGVTERVEDHLGHSAPWTDAQRQQAEELREAIGEVLASRYGQVRSQNELLAASNEEYDAFAHAAAHDLKGPLRGIRLTTELLLEDTRDRLTGDEPAQFERVIRLTERMGTLLDDLLAYARVGRGAWHPEPVALPEAVGQAVDLLGDRPAEASITVAPHAFTMDPAALRQLLFNLIGNAIKYSDGPASVSVGVEQLSAVARQAPPPATFEPSGPDAPVLVVADRGRGIDPAHHERIFDLFRQLDPGAEGSGTGLALCRLIARRHGGDIWVRSAVGEGTTVYVATA